MWTDHAFKKSVSKTLLFSNLFKQPALNIEFFLYFLASKGEASIDEKEGRILFFKFQEQGFPHLFNYKFSISSLDTSKKPYEINPLFSHEFNKTLKNPEVFKNYVFHEERLFFENPEKYRQALEVLESYFEF